MAPLNAIDPQDSRLEEASVWPPRRPPSTDADDDGALLWRLALAAALAVVALAAAGSLLA